MSPLWQASIGWGELEVDLPTRPLTLPPTPASLRLPSSPSLAHPHFDKRDTEFIRRLRSNCLQAIFTLFAFITSLMSLIMGLLCGAVFFSSPLPIFRWISYPPSPLILHIFNVWLFIIIALFLGVIIDSLGLRLFTNLILDNCGEVCECYFWKYF